MIWSDDTRLIARQWSQVARGLQGGMLSFDRLLQCDALRYVRTRMEVVDKQTIGTAPSACSLRKCIFVISCLRSGNGNSLHSLAGWALCKIRPCARWRQAHCCTEKNGTFVPTRLKWHFANLLIQIVKSKMCTSGFISIFLPTSLSLALPLSLYRLLICCRLEHPVVAPKVSSHNSVILSDQAQPVWLFVWTKCGTMAWSYATCLHADVGDFASCLPVWDGYAYRVQSCPNW